MAEKDKNMQTAQDVIDGGWKPGDDFEIGFTIGGPAPAKGAAGKPEPKKK